MTDRQVTASVLVIAATAYLTVPIAVDLSERETDVFAAVLLSSSISYYAYQDHKREKSPKVLSRIVIWYGLAMAILMVAFLLIFPGTPFAVLIPFNAIVGGIMYLHIDKRVPLNS